LPYDLSEGDIITIFSQYGEPVHINLVRDKETGKSKGFAFLKYEDQRSTDLAVDNLGGATVMGRMLRVDHVRYKRRDEEGEDDNVAQMTSNTAGNQKSTHTRARGDSPPQEDEAETDAELARPLLKEEIELQELIRDHDDEDPMKEYLIQEKKEEIAQARDRSQRESRNSRKSHHTHDEGRERTHRHHHHHRHRRSKNKSKSQERRRQESPRMVSRGGEKQTPRSRYDRLEEKSRTHRSRTKSSSPGNRYSDSKGYRDR
jgi:RNA-binding motif protein, X-linked 2